MPKTTWDHLASRSRKASAGLSIRDEVVIALIAGAISAKLIYEKDAWIPNILLPLLIGISGALLWMLLRFLWRFVFTVPIEMGAELEAARVATQSELPNPRPLLVPIGYGNTTDYRNGLWVKNEGGVTAHSLLIPDTKFGASILRFTQIPARLGVDQQAMCECWMDTDNATDESGSGLRSALIKANVGSQDVLFRYKDAENRWFKTNCKLTPTTAGLIPELVGQELTPPNVPILDARIEFNALNGHLFLTVTDQNAGADIWAPMQIRGLVKNKPNGDFYARWNHSSAIRTRISKGQTLNLLLAKLNRYLDHSMLWSLFANSELSGPVQCDAYYSSIMGNRDAQAPDIELRVDLVSDPDTDTGMQSFYVVLHSGTADEISTWTGDVV